MPTDYPLPAPPSSDVTIATCGCGCFMYLLMIAGLIAIIIASIWIAAEVGIIG